ncbi:MAG: hypothetical protein H7A33_01760 [Deltaproteobacteria bacterium]|nr:hypothetical protein [Deltaproteobacteria bacterium]
MDDKKALKQNTNWPSFAKIHTLAMDFDGVFTNNMVWVNQEGQEWVRCTRADGLGFDLIRTLEAQGQFKTEYFVLSSQVNPIVSARMGKKGITCYQNIQNKKEFLEEHFDQNQKAKETGFSGLIYLGNDLNDLKVMQSACFSVAPSDAHPLVQEAANVVLPQKGGEGFVRAFIENWIEANQIKIESLL